MLKFQHLQPPPPPSSFSSPPPAPPWRGLDYNRVGTFEESCGFATVDQEAGDAAAANFVVFSNIM